MSFINRISKTQRVGLVLVILTLLIDFLLYSLVIPVIPYFVQQFNPSSTVIGILFGSYAMGCLLTTTLFGALTDRIGRRIPILIGLGVLATSTLLFAFAKTLIVLIIARWIQGMAAACTWASAFALLSDLFPADQRITATAITLTGIEIGSLLGAPIGGCLFEMGRYETPFLFAITLIAIQTVLVYFFLEEPQQKEERKPMCIRGFLKNRSMLLLLGLVVLTASTLYLLEPILPPYLGENFNLGPAMTGLLFGAMTVAYGGSASISSRLANKYSPLKVAFGGILGLAIAMSSLMFFTSLWQVALTMVLIGAGVSFVISPTLLALGNMADRNGSRSYGVVYGIFNMFHSFGMIVGPITGGILGDIFPVSTTIFIVSITLLIFSCLLLHSLRRQATV